jgi:hypothetical protein
MAATSTVEDARRSKSLEVLIPILYLKGVSTGDFEEALIALLGKDAGGLSASTIARLKDAWSDEHARWSKRLHARPIRAPVGCGGARRVVHQLIKAELAGVSEHARAVALDVFVEPNAGAERLSTRPCTRKSRLFGNPWLMSALPPKAIGPSAPGKERIG